MTLSALLVVLQLIYLEGILSLDNAAVLAAMVAPLPRTEPIPWPRFLRFFKAPAQRMFGGQRPAALKVGLLGAYLGRGLMLVVAASIINNKWLMLLGGLFLIKLAADYLGDRPSSVTPLTAVGEAPPRRLPQRSFWSVVLAVELADLVFSLDNVVAAVGLSRDIRVVLVGVALGILLMRLAASLFGHFLERYPILEGATYLIVLEIGIEVCVEELLRVHVADSMKFVVTLATLLLALWYERSPLLQHAARPLWPLKRVMGVVSLLFLYPLKLLAWLSAALLAGLRVIMLLVVVRPRRAPPKR